MHIRAYVRFWAAGILRAQQKIAGISHEVISHAETCSTPVIYVANHQSSYESVAFNLLVPDIAIIAKQELGNVPIFGWFLRRMPMILIDRSGGVDALKDLIRQCSHAIADGRSILMFPEGTRVAPGETRPFQAGLAAIIREFALPCVPVVHDSGAYLSPHCDVQYSGVIRFRFLPAIDPAAQDARALALGLEDTINREKQALLNEFEAND